MKKNQTDVMEVEVEEMLPKLELEKEINSALIKGNITNQILAELKLRFSDVRLKSIDDKESYLECKEASKVIRGVEIDIEKLCKKGREKAIEIQKAWIAKQKELLSKTGETKDPIDEDIKRFDDEVERIEKEEAAKREELFMSKQSQLLKYGAEYKNGSYELGHISYELELIKQSDEDMWNDTILPKYRKVFEEKEIERVAEEDKRKEEAAKLKAKQDKFEEDQKKFKEQQDLFKQQQADLQKQKDDAEKEISELKLQKQREIDAANERKWRDMLSKLNDIGWNGQFAFPRLGNDETRVFTYDELVHLPDEAFDKRAKEYNNSTDSLKKELEEKRLAKIEEDKQAAIKKALEDQKAAEEEKRLAKIEQDRLDAIKKQQDLDASNDKAKYEDVVSYLLKTPIHEMKSGVYRGKMNVIKDFLNDLKS